MNYIKLNEINFSYTMSRVSAMLKKEWVEIRRDYHTYFMAIFIPLVQALLFGFIMQSDPKNLPTGVLIYDKSPFSNSIIQAFKNTGYFNIVKFTLDEHEARRLLKNGEVSFLLTIPAQFSQNIIKNRHPHILLEGDATNPLIVGGALGAAKDVSNHLLDRDLTGPLAFLKSKPPLFYVDTHNVYNPNIDSKYHNIPSLLSIILSFTAVMLTAIAIAGEYERGTMEVLLIQPINTLEVILGKMIPRLIIAYIVFVIMLLIAIYIFQIPFYGSFWLLASCTFPYILGNLGIGILVSTISHNQFKAAYLANSFLLPSVILSGFIFPFQAMPIWAQWIGELLPVTHYMRLTSAIMIKGSNFFGIWNELWPLLLFAVCILYVGIKNSRTTL